MPIASTNAVGVYLNKEAVWNETPSSPLMQQVRYTGESLVFGKRTDQSATIRQDRMRDGIALLGWETSGDINYELEFFDYDELIAGAMYSAWIGASTVSGTNVSFTTTTIADAGNRFASVPVGAYVWVTGSTVSANNRRYRVTASAAGAITVSPAPTVAAAGPNITVSVGGINVVTAATTLTATVAGSTLTFGGSTGFNPVTATNFKVGQFIGVTGFANAANNGIKRIVAMTATSLTFAEAGTAETVTAATTLTFVGRNIRNGVLQNSYHIQKAFTDISQYISFRGMRVGSWTLDVTSMEIITGAFSFMGSRAVRGGASYAGSIDPTPNTTLMTASANVGTVFQNGSAILAGVRAITLEVNNNLRTSNQVGSPYAYAIGYGFQDVTGTIEVYFEDATMYDQLINHTATELSWRMTDAYGHDYQITLPSVLFTEGYPQAGGGNDDVILPLSFQAVRNAAYDCQIQVDAIPDLTA